MRVLDALHKPWAIQPEMLITMIEICERHARGELADKQAIEAALGKPLANGPKPYQVEDGVAIINVMGVLSKRMDMFADISGGASTQRLQQEFAQAVADPGIHSIVLAIDSPGGAVDGVQQLSDDIYAARGKKPVYAFIDGYGTSGAYWVASAAGKIYLASDTTITGSIGVVLAHTDVSKAQAMRGVKTTEITAGKYKRIVSNYSPLSDEGRATMQEMVDHMYSVFVNNVGRNRGASAETVLKDMADGRIFLGQQAVDAGLADGFANLDSLIEALNQDWQRAAITGAAAPILTKGKTIMSEVKSAPDPNSAEVKALTDAAFAKGKAEGTAEGKALGVTEGATTERERIKAVEACKLPGHKALIIEMKFDGKTTGPEAAVRILQAEKKKQAEVKANLENDAPDPLASGSEADPNREKDAAKGGAADAATTDEDRVKKIGAEATEVAHKAKALIATEKAKGLTVGISEAVARIRKEMGLK